jgi:dimethylamine monooxygenase subunit C
MMIAAQDFEMPVPTIFSRPRYKPFELIPVARSHLVVAETRQVPHADVPKSWADAPIEFWTVAAESAVFDAAVVRDGIPQRGFRSASHLLDRLAYRLEHEHVGLHLYVIGTEPFIWDVVKLVRGFGMDSDEYHITHQGSEKRRVYCVHCRTMTQDVTTNIATCSGCGAHLQVRDHFSRRLAAFIGVQIDAEVPGDIPPVEEPFP